VQHPKKGPVKVTRPEIRTQNAGENMPPTFASDGCVMPNMQRDTFTVSLTGKCEHALIRGASVTLRAPNVEAATDYVATWLRIPNTDIVGAIPATVPAPVTDDEILTRAGDILLARGEMIPPGHAENAGAATCYLTASYIRQERAS
jgi:hypothetical protein